MYAQANTSDRIAHQGMEDCKTEDPQKKDCKTEGLTLNVLDGQVPVNGSGPISRPQFSNESNKNECFGPSFWLPDK